MISIENYRRVYSFLSYKNLNYFSLRTSQKKSQSFIWKKTSTLFSFSSFQHVQNSLEKKIKNSKVFPLLYVQWMSYWKFVKSLTIEHIHTIQNNSINCFPISSSLESISKISMDFSFKSYQVIRIWSINIGLFFVSFSHHHHLIWAIVVSLFRNKQVDFGFLSIWNC